MSDLISRSALGIGYANPLVFDNDYAKGWNSAVEIIKKAPAVNAVEVVHGRWEKVIPTKSAAKWSTKVSCSICHRQGYYHHNYCPNCGAKMDGWEKE